jgi:hypothetical protein
MPLIARGCHVCSGSCKVAVVTRRRWVLSRHTLGRLCVRKTVPCTGGDASRKPAEQTDTPAIPARWLWRPFPGPHLGRAVQPRRCAVALPLALAKHCVRRAENLR